jgi:hypothetical protein
LGNCSGKYIEFESADWFLSLAGRKGNFFLGKNRLSEPPWLTINMTSIMFEKSKRGQTPRSRRQDDRRSFSAQNDKYSCEPATQLVTGFSTVGC